MCNEKEPLSPLLILELSLLPFSIFPLPVNNFPSFLHFPLFHILCLFSQWISRNFPVRSLWWAFYRRPPPRLLHHSHQPTFVSQTSSFLISKSKSEKLFAQFYVHRSSGEGCICGWVFMGLDPAPNYPHFNTPCPLQIVPTNDIISPPFKSRFSWWELDSFKNSHALQK